MLNTVLGKLVNNVLGWVVAWIAAAGLFTVAYGMCRTYELLTNVVMF